VTPAPGPSSLRRPLSDDEALVAFLTGEDDAWWSTITEAARAATS
jgi:hypothetical protein